MGPRRLAGRISNGVNGLGAPRLPRRSVHPLTVYRDYSAGARPHLMPDFGAITIISFDAIEAYIYCYYI